MAEKSASPRASASLRSASPMVRTVGRARTVSAPIRTCSCAMVVPPEATRVSFIVLISRRAVTRDYDSTLSKKTCWPPMPRRIVRPAQAAPAASMIALALGAAACGAIAVGALSIGRLALGRVTVKRARFEAFEVDELTVRKLRVHEYEGPPQAGMP